MKTVVAIRKSNGDMEFFKGTYTTVPKNHNFMETELIFGNPYRRVRMDANGPYIVSNGQRVDVKVIIGSFANV